MSLRPDGRTLRVALLAVALAVAPVAAGCSGDDGDSPSSADVPDGSVATVGDVEVSQEQLDGRVEQLMRAQRGGGSSSGSGGSDGGGSDDGGSDAGDDADDSGSDGQAGDSDDADVQQREQLEAQALSSLLQEQAIEQEAAERGIEVDDAEVRRRWRAATRDQFKTERALRRFLGGQTVEDVLRQLRLQELTERIHADVREQAGGNPDKAVARFQREFRERWESRTACDERYSAAGCADDE